jgi:peptidoglycan/LPS O-acetylase OafA/YrhL
LKYIPQLDGLRCIAILLVLIEHFVMPLGHIISAGYYGVDLFFVLSGFLITAKLLDAENDFFKAGKKFMARRIIRIFPVYYLTILVLYLLNDTTAKNYLVYFLTFTFNYVMVSDKLMSTCLNHLWSICVEEQFYLLWPILVLPLRKNMAVLKWIIAVIIIICGIQILFRVASFWVPYNNVGLMPRAYSLAIGGLGAIFLKEQKIPAVILENKWIEYFALLLLCVAACTHFTLKLLVFPFCSLFLILKTTHHGFTIQPLHNFLKHKTIVYCGVISYGIYVYHLPLAYYLSLYLFDPYIWPALHLDASIFKLPVFGFLSFVFAHFSYRYFEKPLLRLKDLYFK